MSIDQVLKKVLKNAKKCAKIKMAEATFTAVKVAKTLAGFCPRKRERLRSIDCDRFWSQQKI